MPRNRSVRVAALGSSVQRSTSHPYPSQKSSALKRRIVVGVLVVLALEEPVSQIIEAIKSTLDKTPPELAADIMERGIVITGGGSQLIGLENAIQAETGMPVHRARHPLYSVVLGSGQCLENFEVLKQVLHAAPQD